MKTKEIAMRKLLSLVAVATVCAFVMNFAAPTRAADEKKAEKGTVKVIVKDEQGKPVEGAAVTVTKPRQRNRNAAGGQAQQAQEQPRQREEPLAKGETGADGTVTLTDVPVGEHQINARKRGVGSARERVTIKEGKNDEVTLTLKQQQRRRQGGGQQ